MKTVLYVEDNAINVLLVQEILAAHSNVQLLTAGDGKTGLDLAQHQHPDLILLDLHLPDMDGATFLRELRADPSGANLLVVIISADAMLDQAQFEGLNVAAYISKPFNLTEFDHMIDGYLGTA